MTSIKDPLGKSIAEIYRQNSKFLSTEFQNFGIGSGQYFFLIELYKNDGISQEVLSERLQVDKGTTARSMKRLEENGYISRLRCENDKRSYKVFLTEKALGIKLDFFKILYKNEKRIKNLVTDEELNMVKTLLKKISKGLGENNNG
ncbi:MAG: MarR family transcriptional regulator [Clostridium sp.]